MEEVRPDEKMYSQIIYKTPDDPELHKILTSKARSSSPKKYKRWSPEISYEERTLRKKQREDHYIKKIYPDERPILLVKRKQKFKNLENPNLIGSVPNEENNFKITRNTELLVDVDKDIEQNKRFIRRFTVVHDKKGEEPNSPRNKNIYKVEGVEYLPEGFLELDPLLLKDEYYFESPVLEEMFREEQRKLKALRRRQYAEKNYQKKRDVTIYVIEDYKDRVIEFMDLWFEKYKRKMTRPELEEVSRRLDTSFENLCKLQDLYLKRKRLLKNKEMKEASKIQGRDWTRAEYVASTPKEIRDYLKNDDKYGHVKSKVKQDPLGVSRWRYSPMYVDKYNQKRNKKHRPLSASNSVSKIGKMSTTSKPASRKNLLLNNGLREDVSSVDNTFYMLSKTNKEDPHQSEKISNIGKSFRGQYDKMVEDFEDLVEKRKIDGGVHGMSQSQIDRQYPRNQGSMSRSNVVQPKRTTFAQNERQIYEEMHPVHNRHDEEIEAYNQIIQEQLKQGRNTGARDNYQPQPVVQKEANYNSDLNKYFDTEINDILDKIKKCKVEGVTDCDVNLGSKYKLMNCTNSLKKGELEQEQYQRPMNSGEEVNRQSTQGFRRLQSSRRNTEKADEMFEKKDIDELKNRVKAATMGRDALAEKDRSMTFHGKLIGDRNEYQRNLVNPEVNRAGEFEGEIEMIKRKTIQVTTEPKNSIEGELLSKKNEQVITRESQGSGNFSFNPRKCKNNLNQQMNELIDEMEIVPVEKNVTNSMIIDGIEYRNVEDLQDLRNKANTTSHGKYSQNRAGAKTILGREMSALEKIETANHANDSEFDDPNEQDQNSEFNRSRHQSEFNQMANKNKGIRQKASTMMHKLHIQDKGGSPIESITDSRMSWASGKYSPNRSKVSSILSKKSGKRKTRKRVTFFDMQILPEENEQDENFIEKVPVGSVKLNKEQREKLIEVLEGPTQEDEDIILTLNEDQVVNVVNQNVGGENLKIALSPELVEQIRSKSEKRISVYPKNFFAMVEKQKLKGSRLTIYPGDFFEGLEQRPSMIRKSVADLREKAISIYPKDLFDLVEKGIDKGDVDTYPQEIFDLLKAYGHYDINDETREKAKSIYPPEFLQMAEKQAERSRDRNKTVYPKELFELADQEKVNADRVSVYPKDLFKMLEKEARSRNMSIYPGDFFKMLNDEYANVVELNPEQTEMVVKANTGQRTTQIVISPSQRKTLLAGLKEHKAKEEELRKEMNLGEEDEDMAINDDYLEPPTLTLEKDQVMDIFNQNCVMNGAEIELTESQMNLLERPDTVRDTVIGGAYYDALLDELVDDFGQRLPLSRMSVRDRKSVLSNLREKTFSVMIKGEENDVPVMIDEAFFDVDQDAIINTRTNEIITTGVMNSGQRMRVLSAITQRNQSPSPSVLLGNVYYDALVDELVDKNGKRHTLKKMSLLDLQNLVDEQDCERVNVVVQPNESKVMILEDVTYLPIEDCLIDAQERKTQLTDLNDEQRMLLMSALGDRKGTILNEQDSMMKMRLSMKGGVLFPEQSEEHYRVKVQNVNDSELDDRERDIEAIRNRKKTGYPMKKKQSSSSESEEYPSIKITKEGSRLDPRDEQEREKVRNRKKTENPAARKSGIKTVDDLFEEKDSLRYRGSMAFRKKNYTGGLRGKANTIHPKAKKGMKKKTVRIMGQNMEVLVDESEKKIVGDPRRDKKISPKRLTMHKKKKGKKHRNTVLGKLTEEDKNKMVEEEFVKNSRKSKNTRKSKISAKKSIVMEDIKRKSKPSFVKKLIEGDENQEIPEKRHTMSERKRKSESPRTKAKTFMGKDTRKSLKSSDSEVEEIEQQKVEPEVVDMREVEDELVVEEEGLTREEKLKKFEEMNKESGVSPGGRRTFVHTRKSKRESPNRTRGKTYANKLVGDEIIPEEKTRDVVMHEYHDPRVRSSDERHQSNETEERPLSRQKELDQTSSTQTIPRKSKKSKSKDSKLYKHQSVQPPRGTNLRIEELINQRSFGKPRNVRIDEEGYISGVSDDALRERIQALFNEEKMKMSQNLMDQCKDYIDSNNQTQRFGEDLMEEFYRFCKNKLPSDEKYKETVMFVSLFYYFMEKKRHLG